MSNSLANPIKFLHSVSARSPGLEEALSFEILNAVMNELDNLGDTSTLAEPAVVDDLIKNRANTQ